MEASRHSAMQKQINRRMTNKLMIESGFFSSSICSFASVLSASLTYIDETLEGFNKRFYLISD